MKTVAVQIPEVHIVQIEVKVPDNATRDEIIGMANKKFNDEGFDDSEYSHTLEEDEWIVSDEKGVIVK